MVNSPLHYLQIIATGKATKKWATYLLPDMHYAGRNFIKVNTI